MTESEELEMDEIESEVDEETGLTIEERQRHIGRKRGHDDLGARIAGGGSTTKNESADRTVLRDLLINGALIGLWYVFSLSISIVGSMPSPGRMHTDNPPVQQMDVLLRPPRFPLPAVHHITPYVGTVLSGLSSPGPHTFPSAPSNTIALWLKRAHQATDHAPLLPNSLNTLRHDHLARHRARQ